MPRETHTVTREDIMDPLEYSAARNEMRKHVTAMKKNRRVHVGPDATAYFESFDTIIHQIHEMLHIEKGGEEQIKDELNAYATLVPNGNELVATLMFEIDDPQRRANFLAGLGGVEETVSMEISIDGGKSEKIMAQPETDIDRTTADGKASSIQFLHFPFNDEQAKMFKDGRVSAVLSIAYPKYTHMAGLADEVRAALASDLI